jgi:hypothetical protein
MTSAHEKTDIAYSPHTAARTAAAPAMSLGARELLLAAVLASSLALFVRPVSDPDFWYHVRVGRWIVEHGRLPGTDLFTYTVAGHAWVDHEWLSEVLMWLVYARLGAAGVSVAFGIVTWLGLLLVLAAVRPGRQPYVIVGLAMALAAVAGSPLLGPRPQVFTFALAALELLWLRRYLEGESRAVLWSPLLVALWGNLHGGWPVGLGLIAIALIAELGAWLPGRDRERLRRARTLATVAAVSLAAVALNPNGLAIYAYPFQTLASPAQQGLIAEWQSPDFHLAALRGFEAMVILLLVGLAVSRRIGLFDVLLVVAGLALALQSVRHIPLFIVAATPVLVAAWSGAWRGAKHRLPELPQARGTGRGMSALTAALLIAVAAAIAAGVRGDLARQDQVTSQSFPTGAAAWLDAHPGTGTRMFNDYAWGGYLAARFYPAPNRRVFVFGEAALMGDDQIQRYQTAQTLAPGWRGVLDAAGVDYVVDDPAAPLSNALATMPGWRLAYRDRTAVVYVKESRAGGA